MSEKNAQSFIIKARTDKTLQKSLKVIAVTDKKAAIQKIVEAGAAAGFKFTAKEFEQAAMVKYLSERGGVEELSVKGESTVSACNCTGCAACAACLACLACATCAWCIIIPIGGEVAIAADAAAIISAAAAAATAASFGIATAAQNA
jgi:predicted ribosomally synthesized peptide with nif11-like leader